MNAAEEFVNDFLAHHGIKGQKWGIRRRRKEIQRAAATARKESLTEGGSRSRFRLGLRPRDYGDVRRANQAARAAGQAKAIELKEAKKTAKGDKKFERTARSVGAYGRLHGAAADHFNNHITALNSKPYVIKAANNGDLHNPNSAAYKQYHKEASKLYLDGARKGAANEGMNPSRTKRIAVRETPEEWEFDVVLVDVKHSDLSHEDISFRIIFEHDTKGLITGVHLDEMAQGMNVVEDILEHHGVKGMKWGVRSTNRPSGGTTTTVKTRRFRKTKVKVKGGRGGPAHPEAIEAREKQRVLKKSGVNALSNKDLQMLQNRLNLEQNVSRLSKRKVRKGEEYVTQQLKSGTKKVVKGSKTGVAVAAAFA